MKQWFINIKTELGAIGSLPMLINWIAQKGVLNQVRFYAYIVFLFILKITLVHNKENLTKKIAKCTKQVKTLDWAYKDIKSKYMFLTKESEMAKNAASIGLVLNNDVAKKIEVVIPNNTNN
jgi:hypothetical protein